ncbi:MAG: ribonuclease III [Candidatus Doudnabacteria bacterium CG10_big_fil_rev_8_21_14_0_10_42_18]|uniref:Ribonuclease 3 n=1 Tax=Candidatus Doudnabacteria bacterium CG10_big_fil_rev_8_21_14_0_10_42_18 TaxID=1974552 RepID=A0A2H0VB31_9BACT|nr:MAG: ribonuclease III [Candidatus Doudnabacteria bacterium CG10_big_fil_rev_8_21_14_0_10_42_18]
MPQLDKREIEEILHTKIKDPDLYLSAFTHRSYLNEHRSFHLPHNERLEFLGDAVLELAATEYLYRNYSHPEGELTNFRSALVNYKMLAFIASRLGFEKFLLMSRGEAKDKGRARQVILANCIEAVIGAMYMDLGYKPTEEFIRKEILVELADIIEDGKYLDPKSQLQEKVQEKSGITPTYSVVSETGPDHNKVFVVAAMVGDKKVGEGKGPSKQEGELAAAEDALKKHKF